VYRPALVAELRDRPYEFDIADLVTSNKAGAVNAGLSADGHAIHVDRDDAGIRAARRVGRDVRLGDMHRIARRLSLTCCTATDLDIGRTTASEPVVRSVATRQPIGLARR
jgi:hypothetical protein